MNIRPAGPKDFTRVAQYIRQEDLQEARLWMRCPNSTPEEILSCVAAHSYENLAVCDDQDRALAVFGSGPWGDVWFIGADGIETVARALVRQMPMWVRALHCRFGTLHAYTCDCNPMHLKWAEAVGFTQTGDTITVLGTPFRHIIYQR